MKNQLKLNEPKKAKLHSIVDVGLDFSAMIRLFEKGSKRKLHREMLNRIEEMFDAKSEGEFKRSHSKFCKWGEKEISLARKTKPPSYGQIAKTLDVVLKVAVYYCHLPDCVKYLQISKWLNAAVDTKMMNFLRERYPEQIKPWPKTIAQVHNSDYMKIQEIVRKFINTEHNGRITPVQFDDMYWEALNRQRLP